MAFEVDERSPRSGSGDGSGGPGQRVVSSGSRGRGGRGSATTSRGVSVQVEKNIGTIHGDLFTRDLDQDKQGTKGAKVDTIANYVRIVRHPESAIYQYHVKFTPVVDSKAMREEILKLAGFVENVIFDGAMLYSPESFGAEKIVTGQHPNSGKEIEVTITSTVRFSNNDPQAIHVYDLLIRRAMKMSRLVPIARHFFDPKASLAVPKFSIECWPGFQTAARLHEDGLMLCIENRWKVLRKDTVYDLMSGVLSRAGGDNEKFAAECERLLPGQTIITLHNNKMYRIARMDHEMTPQSTFTQANGNEQTFVEYFKENYGIKINDLHQPMLVSEGKPKQPGEPPQVIYLVPELCHMTGITDEMRNNMAVMRAMSTVTRLTPEARVKMTRDWLHKVAIDDSIQRMFKTWDFELDKDLVQFSARQLEPEKLYGTGMGRTYSSGPGAEWARLVKSNGNCLSRSMVNWIIVCPNIPNAVTAATRFIEECRMTGKALGMDVGEPMKKGIQTGDPTEYNQVVRDAIAEGLKLLGDGAKIDMVVVLLKDDNKTRYDSLKKVLCVDLPVPSQCIKLSTLLGKPTERGENKNFGSIVLKIMLQINCKMGGAIWKVKIPFKRGMVVGYDLYTDSTTRGKAAGACVSSYDQEFTQWYSQCRPHENPTELGNNLCYFVRKALRQYYEKNNEELPDRLFLYRDGVGDGQIPYILKQEIPLVRDACNEVCKIAGRTEPIKIAFTLVTKKVNTRILKRVGQGATNPLPGTVVDHMITRPERYDFYMVPQAVNQGTVTPVHYSVLWDETGFDADKHQCLAFKLCHLYYNWQGTVRVPAPCQYAHKLAFLYAQSLHRDAHSTLRDKLYYL